MPTICPKCSHIREPDTNVPAWQCPSCGVAYAKVGDVARASHASSGMPRPATSDVPGNRFPWFKLILFALLMYGGWAATNLQRHGTVEHAESISETSTEDLPTLAAMVRPGEVVIYTTSRCPYCAQAKGWLKQNGFAFTECNIETDWSCESTFRSLSGVGVPYLVVRGQHMKDGFNSDYFIYLLRQKGGNKY